MCDDTAANTSHNIEDLIEENEQLKAEIKKLSAALQKFEPKGTEEVACQTDDINLGDAEPQTNADWTNGKQPEQISIAEMVRSAAEQAQTEMHLPGYVLTASGHYYNAESGYYYDPPSMLFYHPSTQQYYKYNETTSQYTVYTGEEELLTVPVQKSDKKWSSGYYNKMARRYGRVEKVDVKGSEPAVFEVLVDMLDTVCTDREGAKYRRPKRTYAQMMQHSEYKDEPEIVEEVIDLTVEDEVSSTESDTDSEDEAQFPEHIRRMRQIERESKKFAPCIRLMQHPGAMLSIVTITGATIGRDKDCDVVVNDENASRKHANISYNAKSKQYEIVDNNSSNGTMLSGHCLEPLESVSIEHGDVIIICSVKLHVHLHSGNNTCAECEPGIMGIAPSSSNAPDAPIFGWKGMAGRERTRKQHLKSLKKSYGLERDNVNRLSVMAGYADRAEQRRVEVGSEHESHTDGKEQPASVHKAISSGNKGFKMMEKMGWKEGTTLGKTNEGISEPISATVRIGRSGLGSGTDAQMSMDEGGGTLGRRKQVALKTVARFNKAKERIPVEFHEDENGDDDLVVIKETKRYCE